MILDKVPDTPPQPMGEGWTEKDTLNADDLDVAINERMSVEIGERTTVLPEDQAERNNVTSNSLSPIHKSSSSAQVIDPSCRPSPRLQPLLQNDTRALREDSDGPEKTLGSKAASFYIGGDEVHSPLTRQKSQASSGTPWKVSVAGARVVEFTPPDGGYGWVVALASCFINLWIVGFIKSYGFLYVAIREAFSEASAYHISWISSLLSTVGLLTAPVTGIMCRRFTSRKVSFFGGLVCFFGLLCGSMAVNVNQVIASVGLLTGLGAGITTTSGILIVSLYFERRRTFASSVCLSGNALGGFFLPPLVDYLLKAYGLRGTLLILAALQLHICAASLFFRPISDHAMVQASEFKKKAGDKDSKNVIPLATPSSRFETLCCRVKKRYASVESIKESELQQQVSFLRSASMMNSVPNLTLYARSWSLSAEPIFLDSRPSFHLRSRSSLSNHSSYLFKFPLFIEHPSVSQLSSEDDSVSISTPVHIHHHGGHTRSLSRILDRRSSLTHQTSIRTVHSRIMKPVPEQDKEDCEAILQSLISDSDEIPENPQMKNNEKKNEMLKSEKDKNQEGEDDLEQTRKMNRCRGCLQGICDTSLFRDGLFWLMSISVFLVACGTPFSFFYFPSYTDSISISSSVTTGMLSIASILDLIGRLGTGFISDLHLCQLHYIYFFSSLVAGVAALILPHITNTAALTVILCLLNLFVGSWFVMIPAVLAAHHGASKLASSYSTIRFFNGIMNFISPQVTGMLYDATQSYKAVYTLMGSSMVTGAMMVLLTPLIRRSTMDKKENNNNDSSSVRHEPLKTQKQNRDDNISIV